MYSKSDTFRKTIENFIKYALKTDLFKDESISEEELNRILFKNFEDYILDLEIKFNSVEQIREDIIDAFIKERNSKEKFHIVYSEYIKFMNKNYFNDKSEQLKELPSYYSDLERRLLIAKKMHGEFNLSEIAREFLVSERTIQNDLSVLKNGEISVLNQELKVEYESRRNNHIKMKTKAHPLFLVENLTQVIGILNGLRYVYEKDYGYREYVLETAVSIWMQLSEDAKDRILNILIDELNLDETWYRKISHLAEMENNRLIFKKEEAFAKSKFLDILKNGKSCCVEYTDENGEVVNQYFDRIKMGRNHKIKGVIIKENREIEIDEEKIICFIPSIAKPENPRKK